MITRLLFLFVFLIGCAKHKNKPQPQENLYSDPLEAKRQLYCDKSLPIYQAQRWVVDECDGAGFTSLYALACPNNGVDLSVFRDETGRMHRSPNHTACWDYSKSRQENRDLGHAAGYSKDHTLMRMVAAYEQKDIDWITGFIKYVEDNNLVFCEARDEITKVSRCVLSSSLYLTLKAAQRKLRDQNPGLPGDDDEEEPNLKLATLGLQKGFQAHLDIQHIRLRGMIYGGITNAQKKRLRGYAEREPQNGLFQAVAYVYGVTGRESVEQALGNQSYFPNDRLPGDQDICDTYVFSRDGRNSDGSVNKDWLPCPERGRTHSGTDYSFAIHVLETSGVWK